MKLVKWMHVHELTRPQFAEAIGVDYVRLNNLISGGTYPTGTELDKIERIFGGMPAEVYFDAEMLQHRHDQVPGTNKAGE